MSTSADCNIDSAGTKTYSTSDGLVITKVGVTSTFRLGCSPGTTVPKLYAEVDGQFLPVVRSATKNEFYEVSFIEEIKGSSSRWIRMNIYDEKSYLDLVEGKPKATPLKTISVSHYGVSGGPMIKAETIATILLIASFFVAHSIKSKLTA